MRLRHKLLALAAIAASGAVAGGLELRAARAKSDVWSAYPAYTESLRRGLVENDFAHEFVAPEDREKLRASFAFVGAAPSQEAAVLALIAWINKETASREVNSVRAVDLLAAKSGACEIHALAAGVLEAFDIKARWISGVKSSVGFGYLEAFTEGHWQLFKLRDPEHTQLGKSAWQLYNESEPGLSIRSFYPKPRQSYTSWRGPVYPVLFPAANVKQHPELAVLFTTRTGVTVDPRRFDPTAYAYAWFGGADDAWIKEGTVEPNFQRELRNWQAARKLRVLDLKFVRVEWIKPLEYIPGAPELRIVFP